MSDKKDYKSMTKKEMEAYFNSLKKTKAGIDAQLEELTQYMSEELRAGRYVPEDVTVLKDMEYTPDLDNAEVKSFAQGWMDAHRNDKATYGKFVTTAKIRAMPQFKGRTDDELADMGVLIKDQSKKVSFGVKKA